MASSATVRAAHRSSLALTLAVLRCRLPGRPTTDCLFADVSRDGVTALKVCIYLPFSRLQGGMELHHLVVVFATARSNGPALPRQCRRGTHCQEPVLPLPLRQQVWNGNAVTAVVACFNIQGAAYERALRRFNMHDALPPALTAFVRPSDVPVLAGAAELFAAYLDSTKVPRRRPGPGGQAEPGIKLAGCVCHISACASDAPPARCFRLSLSHALAAPTLPPLDLAIAPPFPWPGAAAGRSSRLRGGAPGGRRRQRHRHALPSDRGGRRAVCAHGPDRHAQRRRRGAQVGSLGMCKAHYRLRMSRRVWTCLLAGWSLVVLTLSP